MCSTKSSSIVIFNTNIALPALILHFWRLLCSHSVEEFSLCLPRPPIGPDPSSRTLCRTANSHSCGYWDSSYLLRSRELPSWRTPSVTYAWSRTSIPSQYRTMISDRVSP
jgi:hypothetical protein